MDFHVTLCPRLFKVRKREKKRKRYSGRLKSNHIRRMGKRLELNIQNSKEP